MARAPTLGTRRRLINSNAKGKVGEREFAEILRNAGFIDARRGQQFAGGSDSPDVVCEMLSHVHFEVKRTQAGNPYVWMAQAIEDAGGKVPIVAHRRNRQDWIAILRMDDLLQLLGHPLSQQPACEPPGAAPVASSDKPDA